MRHLIVASIFAGTVFASCAAFAWTDPTGTPPNGNVAAPINEGSAAQSKNGTLGVNGLAVFGNSLLSGADRYLNWGTTAGLAGYGIRDLSGTLQFKNNGGNWETLQTIVNNYMAFSGQWATSGTSLYYNAGSVGVGTNIPFARFTVATAATNPTNGIDTFGLTTTGGYGGGIGLQDGSGNFGIWLDTTGTAARFGFGTSLGGLTASMSILNSGNVGIGTASPNAKLDVQGTLRIGHGNVAGYQFTEAPDDTYIKLSYYSTATNEYTPNILNMTYTGNVGIGTPNPTQSCM